MPVVAWDSASFLARYPEFSQVPTATLQSYFTEAGTLYLNNTDASPVADVSVRQLLLWQVTAHLAALYSGVNGNAPQDGVGRVDQASQGSVSAHLDMGQTTSRQAWWFQTKYGAAFWRASASYRTMQYFAPPQPVHNAKPPWLL